MWKTCKVAQREYLETVKTKTFLLGLLVLPAIIGIVVLFGERLAPRKDAPRAPPFLSTLNLPEFATPAILVRSCCSGSPQCAPSSAG